MRRIRILFFNRLVGCHVGGTETHIKEMAQRLAERGHEVYILTTRGEELKDLEKTIRVWYIGKNWREDPYSRGVKSDPWLLLYASIFAVKSLFKLVELRLKGVKLDVISVHCALEAFLMRFFRWFLRTPYVFVFEGYTDVEAWLAKHSDVKIAISKTVADKCLNKYGYEPIVIPVGVDRVRFTPDGSKIPLGYSGDMQIVLGVGRLSPPKNFDKLIQAASVVSRAEQRLQFLIVGDGSERKNLEMLISKLGLEGKVRLVGRVSDEELPKYYRSGNIFVNTEVNGGDQFWIVVVEAMASGLPVIVTAKSGLPEVVGDAGVWVPPDSPELLAERILELASNSAVRKELAAKSLARAERYDWAKLIMEYEKAYQSAVEEYHRT